MTDRDPGEGFFDHLDDPSWPAPGNDRLDAVVRRGRHLRARRRSAWAASAAAGVTLAVVGGLGISHAINATGPDDRVFQPAGPSGSASAPGTGHRRHHQGGGNQVLLPGGSPAPGSRPAGIASTPAAAPSPTGNCPPVTTGESPASEPLPGASLPSLAPSPTPTCEPAASPSATPSETGSPAPTDTAEPTSSPT